MASIVAKIRIEKTKPERLDDGRQNPFGTPEKQGNEASNCHPGQRSVKELVDLLYKDPDGSVEVPEDVLERQSGHKKRVTSAGISVLPWETFLREPDRLKDLLHVNNEQHISYSKTSVNALFRATCMDEPSFGDISAQGDEWVITTETLQELDQLRSFLTRRVSILGMSIARYSGRWSTAHRVPCLLMLDPEDTVKETIDTAFAQAVQSVNSGKDFSVQIDLNRCVERWCENMLGVRCQSIGAKIVVTSGEPYQSVLSQDRLLCCVLCLPFWSLQTCLYQIERKSMYDDYNVSPDLNVKIHDGGWVKKERPSKNAHHTQEGVSNRDHGERSDDEDDIIEMSYHSKRTSEFPDHSRRSKSSHKSPKQRTKGEPVVSQQIQENAGKDNNAFEMEAMADGGRNSQSPPSDVRHGEDSKNSSRRSLFRPAMQSRVITSEMLLTDRVELTKYRKTSDRPDVRERLELNRKNTNTTVPATLTKQPLTIVSSTEIPSREVKDSSSFRNPVNGHHSEKEARDKDSSTSTRDDRDYDKIVKSESPIKSENVTYQNQVGLSKKEKYKKGSKILRKPRSILKEIRKTTEGALSILVRNGGEDVTHSSNKSLVRRPSTAVPGARRSVHFDDNSNNIIQPKSNQSWVTEDTVQTKHRSLTCVVAAEASPIKTASSSDHNNGNEPVPLEKHSNENDLTTSKENSKKNALVAEGMLTNAWSFRQRMKSANISGDTGTPRKSVSNPKSFLRPKSKIIFSTDEEDNDSPDWRSSNSRLIHVNGSKSRDIFDTTTLEKDTETDTEVSQFKLEDVDDQEVHYLSDSHISVPSSKKLSNPSYNKSRTKRSSNNVGRYQGKNLPRKRLYNPKKQSLSMLSLNAIE